MNVHTKVHDTYMHTYAYTNTRHTYAHTQHFDAPSGTWQENGDARRNPPWQAVEFRHLGTLGAQGGDASPSTTTKVGA